MNLKSVFLFLVEKAKDFVLWVWGKIKAIHFGYAMVFAIYTISLYFHLLKLVGGKILGLRFLNSNFIEAVVLYVVLVFVVHLMRKHGKA